MLSIKKDLIDVRITGDAVQDIDDETENWPISAKFRGNLDEIKNKYKAHPLPVYTNNRKFVKPTDVKQTIKGALVEVHFELHHYCIRSKMQDSFNATVLQIIIIQPGVPEPVAIYEKECSQGATSYKPRFRNAKQNNW